MIELPPLTATTQTNEIANADPEISPE